MNMTFSKSSLEVFKSCPRCFWLDKVKGVKRPKGIMGSLLTGLDNVLKVWYDSHRAEGRVPKEIPLSGKLYPDQAQIKKWRFWRTGPKTVIQDNGHAFELTCAVDDIFIDPQGLHEVFDYKSRGTEPKDGYSDLYYQLQGDVYALLLQENNMAISGQAHFAYYWPTEARSITEMGMVDIGFGCKVETIAADPGRAIQLAIQAKNCLIDPIPPLAHPNCEYCTFIQERKDFDERQQVSFRK